MILLWELFIPNFINFSNLDYFLVIPCKNYETCCESHNENMFYLNETFVATIYSETCMKLWNFYEVEQEFKLVKYNIMFTNIFQPINQTISGQETNGKYHCSCRPCLVDRTSSIHALGDEIGLIGYPASLCFVARTVLTLGSDPGWTPESVVPLEPPSSHASSMQKDIFVCMSTTEVGDGRRWCTMWKKGKSGWEGFCQFPPHALPYFYPPLSPPDSKPSISPHFQAPSLVPEKVSDTPNSGQRWWW
jgi:hypothetical protein